jgi:murein DD-endopeptidase MepM/ murein hydrolase activator NlpD
MRESRGLLATVTRVALGLAVVISPATVPAIGSSAVEPLVQPDTAEPTASTTAVAGQLSISATAATARVGTTSRVAGTLSPARPGERVYLQRYAGGTWGNVTSTLLSGSSGYAFSVKPATTGRFRYRVRKPATTGLLAVTSAERRLVRYRARITSVRYNATGDDATNLNGEYLTLKNTGTVAINLSGWRVYADAAQVFPLPAYHLAAGATVYVHTGSGTTRAEHVYLGRSSPIWDNTGRDLAIVYDARRAVVSRWFKRFFPVSGCRTWYQSAHHDYPATDVFADKGCRVLAAAAGRVDEVEYVDRWSPTTNYGKDRGGLFVSIVGYDGVRYYASHLASIAPGISPGDHVTAGQLIGRVGTSGSARSTPAHLHFGVSWPTRRGIWWVRRGMVPTYSYLKSWQAGGNASPVAAVRSLRAEVGVEPRCTTAC